MSRRNRSITSFDDVSTDKTEEVSTEANEKTKLEKLMEGKVIEKEPQYLYIEKDIVKVLNKVGGVNRKGRGSKKSAIVNEILREYFTEQDLL